MSYNPEKAPLCPYNPQKVPTRKTQYLAHETLRHPKRYFNDIKWSNPFTNSEPII